MFVIPTDRFAKGRVVFYQAGVVGKEEQFLVRWKTNTLTNTILLNWHAIRAVIPEQPRTAFDVVLEVLKEHLPKPIPSALFLSYANSAVAIAHLNYDTRARYLTSLDCVGCLLRACKLHSPSLSASRTHVGSPCGNCALLFLTFGVVGLKCERHQRRGQG
jgi:hypothetical protein